RIRHYYAPHLAHLRHDRSERLSSSAKFPAVSILDRMALSSLQPLRRKNFALIWTAALVSNVGSWMQTVAVGALVTEATGKSTWTGIVAAAAFIPIGIFAPVGGALADRVDRRRYFIGTTIGETVFAALLAIAVATGNAEPWLVTMLVFCGGVLTALGFPAYQAII